MKKLLVLLLSMLFALGIAFISCSDDNGNGECDCGELECCEDCDFVCPDANDTCVDGMCICDCGEDECCQACDFECPDQKKCAAGTCIDCCPGQDLHAWVEGVAVSFPDQQPIQISLGPVAGLDAALKPNPSFVGSIFICSPPASTTDSIL